MNGGKYDERILDSLIREAVSRNHAKMEPPPLDEFWAGFLQKRRQAMSETLTTRSRFASKWLRRGSVALAMVALVVGLWLASPRASAVGMRAVRFLSAAVTETLTNLMVSLGLAEKSRGTRGGPPPDSPGQTPRTVSLEEARAQAPFRLRLPSFVPEGMTTRTVRFEHLNESTARISVTYGDNEGRHLVLEQVNISEGMGTGLAYDSDDARVEKVQVGGRDGLLIRFKDGSSHLLWVQEDVSLQLYGSVDGDVTLSIARSIK
ncbi:MAG: DUF4367 domain-containing protein [Ignavibacteriales bacterium]